MAAGTNFYGRWCALGACLTGNRESLVPGPEEWLASLWVVLEAFPVEISSIHSILPSKCRNRFCIASRNFCVSSCFCGPLLAEGKETDFPWHDGNSSLSDNSSSKILFLTGTVFAQGSEGMVLFRRLAARAKRFALSRYNKCKKKTHEASEPNDMSTG